MSSQQTIGEALHMRSCPHCGKYISKHQWPRHVGERCEQRPEAPTGRGKVGGDC